MRLTSIFLLSTLMSWSALAETPGTINPCEQKLIIPEFMLFSDRQTDHTAYIHQLENRIIELTKKSRFRLRPTQLRGAVKYETALFNLAGGKSQQVIDMVKSAANSLETSYKRLNELAPKIKELHKAAQLPEGKRAELSELEAEFMAHSQAFGENYGYVKNTILLLESVAAAKGVPESDLFSTHTPSTPATSVVVMDLTAARSVAKAQKALAIIKASGLPDVAKMKEMFMNNKYALRAKLERDLAELEKWNKPHRRAGMAMAFAVMAGTEYLPKISEKMRVHIMQGLGLQVRRFMFNLYLGQIQDIVNVARVRTPDGKLVLLSDDATMREQIRELNEAATQSIGEDLLITFARIVYHRDSWNNIMEAVKRMSEEKTHSGQEMKLLYNRLTAARETAIKLGDMAYVHEPNDAFELQLLVAKAGWIAGTTAAVKYGVMPAASGTMSLVDKFISLFM